MIVILAVMKAILAVMKAILACLSRSLANMSSFLVTGYGKNTPYDGCNLCPVRYSVYFFFRIWARVTHSFGCQYVLLFVLVGVGEEEPLDYRTVE